MTVESNPLKGRIIAFFHQSADLYGSDKILLSLTKSVLISGGHPIVIIPETGPLTLELQKLGIEFHIIPILKLTRSRFSIKGIIALVKENNGIHHFYDLAFNGRKIDLVHSNTVAVLGGAFWARKNKIPHLWHVHEIIEHPWIASNLFPFILKIFSDHIVCNSKATYNWMFSKHAKLSKKMSVIWNGIQKPPDINEVSVSQIKRNFLKNKKLKTIGLIGRINRLKGHVLLLDAIDILVERGITDFSVIFTGSPPQGQEFYEINLRKRISVSKLKDFILIQNFTTDIWPTYAALDIVCIPSTEAEAFGMVAIEAMAMGKPVVAARIGGLKETVVSGLTGLMFEPCNAFELANTLEEVLSNDLLCAKLGNNGKERFYSEYTIDKMNSNFIKKYIDLIRD